MRRTRDRLRIAWRHVSSSDRQRSGIPDPTWQQVGIALIAIGALLTSVAAASQTRASSIVASPVLWTGLVIAGLGVLTIICTAWMAFCRWADDKQSPFVIQYIQSDSQCAEKFDDGSMQLRIAVTNRDGIGVQRVRAFVRFPDNDGRSHFLHLQHDNDLFRRMSREGVLLGFLWVI